MKKALGLICLAWMLAVPTAALPAEAEVESVTVEIRSRVFIPQQIHLHHGRKTLLRFLNHDTELHSVVAKEFFFGVDFDVAWQPFWTS